MLVEIKKMNKDEVTVCTSLDVAETFGKEHKNVLKDIREMDCSEEFGRLNFELSSYLNSQNKRQPMYYMTRDGFTMLVMGYTGEKAMKFKEAYIRQFNAMEKVLIGKMKEREKALLSVRLLPTLCSSQKKMKECMDMLIPHIRTSYIRWYSEKTKNISAKNMAYPKRRIFGIILVRKN